MSAFAWPSQGTQSMPPHAAEYLTSRAIPRSAWRAAGLRYLDASQTSAVVGMGSDEERLVSDSIAVPFSHKGVARLLDKEAAKQRKFSAPPHWPGGIFLAPSQNGALKWPRLLKDARIALYWAEGPLKALGFTWHSGLPAFAFNGLDGWSKDGGPIEDLTSIIVKDRTVVFLVDSDAARKVQAQQSLRRLERHLTVRGAIVLTKLIPSLNGADKTDVNDFIAAHDIGALLAIEDTGMPEDWGAAAATQELNQRLAYLTQGRGEVVLISDDLDFPGTKRVATVSVTKLAPEYKNQKELVSYSDRKGTAIYKSKFDIWLQDPYRRSVERLWLRPSSPWGIDPKTREFNLWWGWGVAPHPPDATHSWDRLQEHVREVIADSDHRSADYIFKWLAYSVQCPSELPEVAIVLTGGEGTGKGTLAKAIGKLFGRHFLHVVTPGQLTGRHNDIMKDKLLVFADENFYAGDHQTASALKTIITETPMLIEPKFVDAYPLPNYRKVIIASNNAWVVPAGHDARRYAVFQVSEARKNDLKYFAKLYEELDRGGYQAMLYDLLHCDLTTFDPRRFPQTRALFDQKRLGFSPVEEWWFERLRASTPKDWPSLLHKEQARLEVESRCATGYDRRGLETQIGIMLRKLCPRVRESRPWLSQGDGRKKRERVFRLPPLDECRGAFEIYTRTTIDWLTGDPKRPADQ